MHYHTLEMNNGKDKIRVIFHISVPNEVNAVAVNLRTALSQWKPVTDTAVPYDYTGKADEVTDLQNGAVYELSEMYDFGGKVSKSKRQAALDARYNELVNDTNGIPQYLRNRLANWGFSRNVI